MPRCRSILLAVAFGLVFASNSTVHGQDNYKIQAPKTTAPNVWDVLNIEPKMRTPKSVDKNFLRQQIEQPQPRPITLKSYTWHPDHLRYGNLMFEEPLVERHGLALGENRQVANSAIKFFARGALFPIQFWRGKHRCCDSNSGWGNQGETLCPKCAGSLGDDR